MHAREVYASLRARIAPWAKASGFRRGTGGMLSFNRPTPSGFLTFWFQCSRDGWDPLRGSKFTLEFVEAPYAGPGEHGRRQRFGSLLSADDREQVRTIQDAVIKRLGRPDRRHWIHAADKAIQQYYFAKFEPEPAYDVNSDIWLRYATASDVQGWVEFLAPRLPNMIDTFSLLGVGLPVGA